MKETRLKIVADWLAFLIFFTLAIGYLPARIACVFICLSVLACPIDPVHSIVDRILELYSKRVIFSFTFLIILGLYPVEDFGILADNIRNALHWINNLIK